MLRPYGFSSMQMTAMRLSIAALGMLIYCLIFKRIAFKTGFSDLLIFAGCGLSIFCTAYFYYESMQMATESIAVILMYISPVPIMIISVLFLGEKFNYKKGIAVFSMLLGCVFVSGVFGDFKPNTLGIIFGLLSALSYTVYNILNKISARRKNDSTKATLYTFIFGALIALLLSRPWQIPAILGKDPLNLIPTVVIHSLVTCLLPYFLYTVSLKSLSVGVASALSIIEPMTTSLLGFLVYDNPLTVYTVIGIVLVVGSVFLLGVSEIKPKITA